MATTQPTVDHFRLGLLLAVGSAFAFGCSGPFAKSLMEAGWSPTAAVTARLAGGALLMVIFATVVKPDWVREALQHSKTVVAYGLIPIAGAQLCYFNAVAHMSVGVALLLEYTAPILVVGWVWATSRRRPSGLTLTGVALAIAGIMLVLGIFGAGGFTVAHINLIGVGWALAAAVCAACYFLMSSSVATDGDGLNSITLATAGLIVGAYLLRTSDNRRHHSEYRNNSPMVGVVFGMFGLAGCPPRLKVDHAIRHCRPPCQLPHASALLRRR